MNMLYETYENQAVDNAKLKTLLQEEKEEKHRLQLQLQATIEAWVELKHNNEILQEKHDALKAFLQE